MLEKYHFLKVMSDDESGDCTVPYCINKCRHMRFAQYILLRSFDQM